ncbi:MAG TPA: UvrD-helicase domain-containing protein, partial [Solirubrobacteraceae bacterium]|nr:UvrD-helicase domain-containing protein [Solirubrobacteraceae bacterium]
MSLALTPAQARAADHPGGPLLVLGAAGTGKTTALVERFVRLIDRGVAPEAVAVLSPTTAGAEALRARLEERLRGPYEELAVHAPSGLGARLLRDEALEAGLDPFAVPAGAGDRLAMLLERV